MMRVRVFSGELRFLTPPPTLYLSHGCKNSTLSYTHKHPSSLISPNYATHNKRFDVSASSAPSLSGSGAEYSEQLVDVGANKKKKGIAGIDQGELVDPKLLADLDSCFCEFNGVHIHHKICDAESQTQSMFQSQTVSHQIKKLGYPMILLHGFGASVFSWKQVMKPLAEVAGSKVLAFDRPAFGLTSRVNLSKNPSSETEDTKPLNAYSMAFSVLATLHFIKLLNAEKVILMGHSAGSLVAVNTYFEAPERVAALILVAPAIFAPLTTPKTVKENQSRRDSQMKEDSSIRRNPILRLYKVMSKITKYIAEAIWIPGFDKWIIEKENRSYIEALCDRREDLVYLTADSETVLEELDLKKIYVIGGLVDRNRWKGITLKKAQEQGIQTAKLPIGNFMKMSSSQVLTVNQVVEILLKFLETRDWKTSFFAVIPQRKRCQSDSEGNAEDTLEEEHELNDDLTASKRKCVEEVPSNS